MTRHTLGTEIAYLPQATSHAKSVVEVVGVGGDDARMMMMMLMKQPQEVAAGKGDR